MTFWPVFVSWRFISSWTLSDSQGLSNCTHVEGLQERTQCALEDYIRTQYPNQPTRFGKLLLRLPSLRLIRPGTVEALFFPPINLASTVESALNEMLVITSVVTSSSNNWANAGFPNGNMNSMNTNGTTVMWLAACGISKREMFTMRRYKYGKITTLWCKIDLCRGREYWELCCEIQKVRVTSEVRISPCKWRMVIEKPSLVFST